MKRLLIAVAVCLCAALVASSPGRAQAQTSADKAKARRAKQKKELQEWCERVKDNYMFSRNEELAEDMAFYRRYRYKLSGAQGKEMSYLHKASKLHRPSWWSKCRSSSNISFPATIWGRKFTANYMPTHSVGYQAARLWRGRIQIVVSWRPSMVDNPEEAGGALAKKHKLTKGHLQEAIVWHELGHNYITYFLPVKHGIALYRNHYMLFEKLQEFYADMTAIYHSSPRARLAAMFLRLSLFGDYDDTESHNRAAHAIGSLILSRILSEPAKWPSIHFPPKVPDKYVERTTIEYVYRHIDPKWTLEEDRALREFIHRFIMKKGQSVLRRRGALPLDNKLSFRLMVGEDRNLQKKRDEWIAEKLKGIMASGRADKPAKDGDKKDKTSTTKPVRVIIIKGRGADIELD